MHRLKTTLVEFVVIAGVGLVIGLIANAFNRDGLDLSENYFRRPAVSPRPSPTPPPLTTTATDPANHGTAPPPERDPLVARIEDELGLQAVTHDEAVETFEDPYRLDGVYLFIDARDDEHYLDGHIPGAVQMDHYHKDRYLPAVLEACAAASRIIVYCEGGECEDSEFATRILLEAGVDWGLLHIYAAGYAAWTEAGLPVEIGPRDSGDIINGSGSEGAP